MQELKVFSNGMLREKNSNLPSTHTHTADNFYVELPITLIDQYLQKNSVFSCDYVYTLCMKF